MRYRRVIWYPADCHRVRVRNHPHYHLDDTLMMGAHFLRARLSRQLNRLATFQSSYRLGPLGRDTDDTVGGGRRRAVR